MSEKEEAVQHKQAFSEFMHGFLTENPSEVVVEIGSDVQLRIALKLAPFCTRFCSVNFPEDNVKMEGWHKMHREMGIENIELIDGNALALSELIPKADVIILHNVLLNLTGKDTELMWKYKRGELECSDEEWSRLVSRFKRAKKEGYEEFLRVARPGYIIVFRRPNPRDDFMSFLTETMGIEIERVRKESLLYDNREDEWECYIIDNT